jgi:signal recognition particle GTPase
LHHNSSVAFEGIPKESNQSNFDVNQTFDNHSRETFHTFRSKHHKFKKQCNDFEQLISDLQLMLVEKNSNYQTNLELYHQCKR